MLSLIQEHLKQTCDGVRIACSAGCGVQLLWNEVGKVEHYTFA